MGSTGSVLRERSLALFGHVMALVPAFEDILHEFLHDAPQLRALFSYVSLSFFSLRTFLMY